MSSRSSRSYAEPENSETEEDMYVYASPEPLEYEVPSNLSGAGFELPERMRYPPPPRTHKKMSSDNSSSDPTLSLVYTTLTHTHMPSIYSTPSHSMEFRSNNTIADSALSLTHQRTADTQIAEETEGGLNLPRKSYSRIKATVVVILLMAVVIGILSLVVGVVAVFVTRGPGGNDVSQDELTALQEEVSELRTVVGQVINQTNGSVDFSAFYESCTTESVRDRCNPEQDSEEVFSCQTAPITLEKEVHMRRFRACDIHA